MSLEFADSFGIYDLIQGIDATASQLALRRRWNGTSVGNTSFCQAGVGPRGGPALVLPQGAALVKTFSHRPIYVSGMNINMFSPSGIGGNGLITFLNNSQPLVTLQVNLDGSILVYAGGVPSSVVMATGIAFTRSVYAYVELKATVSGTTNILVDVEVRVNGVSLGTGSHNTGVNIIDLPSNSATMNRVFLASPVASNGQMYLADFYLLNGNGGLYTDFLGPVEIDAYPLPNGDNASFKNWIPLGGTGANFSEINENPADGLTSYVRSSTIGAVDSYDWQDVLTFTGTIKGVQLTYCALTDDEGDRAFQGNIGAGGTEAQTPVFALAGNFIYHHAPFDADPATGLAWTRVGFNAKQFGLKLVS